MKNATKKSKIEYDPLDREFDLTKIKLTKHTPKTKPTTKIHNLLSAIKIDYNFNDKDFYNGITSFANKLKV